VAQYLDAGLSHLAQRFWAAATTPSDPTQLVPAAQNLLHSATADAVHALCAHHPIVQDQQLPLAKKLRLVPPIATAAACSSALVATSAGACLCVHASAHCLARVTAALPQVQQLQAVELKVDFTAATSQLQAVGFLRCAEALPAEPAVRLVVRGITNTFDASASLQCLLAASSRVHRLDLALALKMARGWPCSDKSFPPQRCSSRSSLLTALRRARA
jgi:hypothetical protein